MISILYAGLAGGAICAIVQLIIDKTKLTPARILTSLVVLGVILYGTGVYDMIFKYVGCGISLPLTGFGAAIAKGVKTAINEVGVFGILTGGLTGTAAGITAALCLGLLFALIGKSHKRVPGKKR